MCYDFSELCYQKKKKEKKRFVRTDLSIRHLWLFISSEKCNPSKHTTKWCIISYYAHLSLVRISRDPQRSLSRLSCVSLQKPIQKSYDSNQENGGDLNFLPEEKFLCLTKSKSFITRASNRSNLRSCTVRGEIEMLYGERRTVQLGRCVSRSPTCCSRGFYAILLSHGDKYSGLGKIIA